jgi:hypothetical protein
MLATLSWLAADDSFDCGSSEDVWHFDLQTLCDDVAWIISGGGGPCERQESRNYDRLRLHRRWSPLSFTLGSNR